MNSRTIPTAACIVLFLVIASRGLATSCWADGVVPTGQIVFLDERDVPTVVEIPGAGAERHVSLDIAVWSKRFTVILPEFAGARWHQMRVEQRNHRCFSVSGEGPHLDFIDWKRQSTGWRVMKRVQNTKWSNVPYRSNAFGDVPTIRPGALKKQVQKQLRDYPEGLSYWIKQAEACEREPGTCLSDCATEMRFFRVSDEGEEHVLTLRIAIPMGC